MNGVDFDGGGDYGSGGEIDIGPFRSPPGRHPTSGTLLAQGILVGSLLPLLAIVLVAIFSAADRRGPRLLGSILGTPLIPLVFLLARS